MSESMEERAERLAALIAPESGGFDRVVVMRCDGETYCRESAREAIAREIIDHYTAEDTDDEIRDSMGNTWWAVFAYDDGDAFPRCGGCGRHGHLVCGACGTDIDRGTPAGTYNGPGVECYNCRATGVYVDGEGYVRDDSGAELVAEIPFYPRDNSGPTYVTVPVIGDRGMTDHAVYVVPGAEGGPMGAAFPAVYVVRTPMLGRLRADRELDHLADELFGSDLRYPHGGGTYSDARRWTSAYAERFGYPFIGKAIEYRIVDK